MKNRFFFAFVFTSFFSPILFASVNFENIKDGQEVESPLKIKMGVVGKTVRPAGESIDEITSGHHHLIIDSEPVPAGAALPTDEKHIHFGKGQTETTVELSPGEHQLTLQFADGAHRSYGPEWSKTIKVVVKKSAKKKSGSKK